MPNEEVIFVGGNIYGKIKCDPGVVPSLSHCLYCQIRHSRFTGGNSISTREIDYQIPLVDLTEFTKQCPACKTVYLLGDPTGGIK